MSTQNQRVCLYSDQIKTITLDYKQSVFKFPEGKSISNGKVVVMHIFQYGNITRNDKVTVDVTTALYENVLKHLNICDKWIYVSPDDTEHYYVINYIEL